MTTCRLKCTRGIAVSKTGRYFTELSGNHSASLGDLNASPS